MHLFVCSADMCKPKLLMHLWRCLGVFCTDSSLQINWVWSEMDGQLVMYVKSDCGKCEQGWNGNAINVLKLLCDGLFHTLGSGCIKSVSLLAVPSLPSVYLVEVTCYPFILKSCQIIFPFLSRTILFFITSSLDLRGKITILLITVFILPFINLLFVLASEALSNRGASVPKWRWWCFRGLQHWVFGLDLLTNLKLEVITVTGLISSHWRWTRSQMRWYTCSSKMKYPSLFRRVNSIF